jgi:hypothetical protein
MGGSGDTGQSSPLRPLPAGFSATVASLHRVAELIVAPARKPQNEIALEATRGGFGTPEFPFEGERHQVRVEGAELVHMVGADERRAPLASLAAAGEIVADLLPSTDELDDVPLAIDPASAAVLANWYDLGEHVLQELVAPAPSEDEPTPPILWPEHFDIAIEMGAKGVGRRANYGFSPGDEEHPEPYAYVGPWTAEVSGELWQARGFRGAELGYAELLGAPDQRAAALDFFVTRQRALKAEVRR